MSVQAEGGRHRKKGTEAETSVPFRAALGRYWVIVVSSNMKRPSGFWRKFATLLREILR